MAEKAVVVIGGGAGIALALRGLKKHPLKITALLSPFDSSHAATPNGGPNAPQIAASSLLALGANDSATEIMERLFDYRLQTAEEPAGLPFGNLLLNALGAITGSPVKALHAAAQVLNMHGTVLPLALDAAPLLARLNDGREVPVESPAQLVEAAASGLQSVGLSRPVAALDVALERIGNADIIMLGPGDLYFDIIAALETDGVRAALERSRAVKIFVCNTVTQPNVSADWPASRFITTVAECLGSPDALDYAILSSTLPNPDAASPASAGARAVALDYDQCLAVGVNVIVRPVSDPDTLCHDPQKLARTILFLGGRNNTLIRPLEGEEPPRHGDRDLLLNGVRASRGVS